MKHVFLYLTTLLFCSGCLSNIDQYATGNPRLKLHFPDQDNYESGTWTLTDFPKTQRPGSGNIDLVIEISEGHSNYIYGSLEAKDSGFTQTPPEPNKRLTIHRDAGSLSLIQGTESTPWSGQFEVQADLTFGDLVRQITGEPISSYRLLTTILRDVKQSTLIAYSEIEIELTSSDLWSFLDRRIKADYVTSMRETHKDFSAKDIIQLRQFGVSPELANEFPEDDASDIIKFRRFGVPPEFARAFRKYNPDYTPQDLISLRKYGVPADWAEPLSGLTKIKEADDLVLLRRFGVPPQFARAAHRYHFVNNADDITALRRHGVTTEFIEALSDVAHSTTTKGIIHLRRSGVTADYYNKMRHSGSYSIDDIVLMKRRGIPTSYVQASQVQGKAPLSSQAIIDLRNRGVSTATIRELRQ